MSLSPDQVAAINAQLSDPAFVTDLAAAQTAIKDAGAVKDAAHQAAIVADCQKLAASLNASTVKRSEPIKIEDARGFLIKEGILAAAYFAAQDQNLDMKLRISCLTARDALMQNAFSSFDINNPTDKALIDQFVGDMITAGVMTPIQRDALYALATVDVPFADSIQAGRALDFGDVMLALGVKWDQFSAPSLNPITGELIPIDEATGLQVRDLETEQAFLKAQKAASATPAPAPAVQ